MYVFLICGILTILVFRLLNTPVQPPVFGIYHQPGVWYHLKTCFIYVMLITRKGLNFWRSAEGDEQQHGDRMKDDQVNATAGYGVKSRPTLESMDCRQTLSDDPKAIDAVYFNLASANGSNLVIGSAHRPHGVVDGFVYLQVAGSGLLLAPKLPDTLLFRGEDKGDNAYGAEGIKLTPFMAMRTWRIQYEGPMKYQDGNLPPVHVKIDAVWSSNLPVFDFDTDMDCLAVARGMARQPWTRNYFHTVQEFHQTHYEQHGDLFGSVQIGETTVPLRMQGVRDHSYARRREWKNFHRYGLHFLTLEDGTRISVGVVCAPLVFSRMELGYVCLPEGKIVPVQSCDIPLEQHGEGGQPPKDYAFTFVAGGQHYVVQVDVVDSPEFYIGWEWESRVVERLARFRVNGIPGFGAAEWQYRHMAGRPAHIQQTDPAWTHNIIKA